MDKITLNLTLKDYQNLVLMLGFAAGAYMKEERELPDSCKEATDWILIQGGGDDVRTYWHSKEELRQRKEAELAGH